MDFEIEDELMDANNVKYFRDDQENITEPNYPNGQRLYEADRRFWLL